MSSLSPYRSLLYSLSLLFLLSSCGVFSGMGGSSGEDELSVDIPEQKGSLTQKDSMRLKSILIDANKEKMIGNKDRALHLFRKAFEIDSALPSAHYEIARILREKKERSKALKHAKMAAAMDPENEWYQKLLAELYVEYGSYEKAAAVYRNLLDRDDPELKLSYQYADALIRAGKHREAISVYDSIESRMGLRPRVHLQKQRLYQRIGDHEKALQEVKELVERYPNEAKYYGVMAELYQKMNEPEKAREAYDRLLDQDPDNGRAHLSISRFYRKNGKKQKAIHHLKKAYRSQSLGVDRKVKVLLSYFSRSRGDAELKKEAYELLDLLVKAHPKEAKSYSIYGDFLARDGKKMKARRMFKKAVKLDPDRFPIWQQILVIDRQKKAYDSLLVDSRKAKEYFPNQPKIYLFEGIALSGKKRYQEAVEPLKFGKSLVVNDDQLKYRFLKRLGEVHYRIGDYTASDQAYDRALDIRSKDPFLLNNYAYYLSERGDSLDKALKMSEKANSLEPGRPSFLDTYGWILYQKGDFKEARKKLKKALDRGGQNSATILEHYGDVLYRTGDKERALEYWKKARKAGSGSDELEQKIREEKLPTP